MKRNQPKPTSKDMFKMILQLEQRLLTLHMFLDAMSAEFEKYLKFKDDTDDFKSFKDKYNEDKKIDKSGNKS